MKDSQYCKSHEMHWYPSEKSENPNAKVKSCPWCQRDRLLDEIEFIKDMFQTAVANHNKKPGGQQVQYHGDFASITPSTAGQMTWYVKRWKEVLKLK